MKKQRFIIASVIIVIIFSFFSYKVYQKNNPGSDVYVTLMAHIEEGDVYPSCVSYPDYRERLLEYANIIHVHGYSMNLQVSYQFFQGVLDCETKQMQENTKGMNVIEFLATEYGFEIDPHHEGAWDWKDEMNFADTRYIGGLVTDKITDLVGIVWDHAPQFAELDAGQQGNVYSEFTFYPTVIGAAVGYDHHLGDFRNDDANSGIWIPAGVNEDWVVHNPEGRMVYIATGPHAGCFRDNIDPFFAREIDYIRVLLEYIGEGRIEDAMLTTTIAIPQAELFGGAQEAMALVAMLDEIRDERHVIFASYSQVIDTWRSKYHSEPQIFLFEDIDPADYTCQ